MSTSVSTNARSNDSQPSLSDQYRTVRQTTLTLCEPLTEEDMAVQAMPDTSPTKWHLAHTTWFFETFLLRRFAPGYESFDEQYHFLFNSYYNSLGSQFDRPRRGLLTRPAFGQIRAYREHVDAAMQRLLSKASTEVARLTTVGLHHEQQHQELLLMDIKYLFGQNPTFPAYRSTDVGSETATATKRHWVSFAPGEIPIGHESDAAFCFDNETPAHRHSVRPFELASRLVTNAEYLEFIQDGGYETPQLWLSDGWNDRLASHRQAPEYWHLRDGQWFEFTLAGLVPLQAAAPVCHVSFYEADAFARWSHARLPTEFEWEAAARTMPVTGNLLEQGLLHPQPAAEAAHAMRQLFGDVWEWTASPYLGYPGYRPAEGALGEYNGKFMCNQFVLRGGSCVTPETHIRATYRNFFPPQARWQFGGFRLARDS